MIIELFGPPAAGKTTFARRLGARLRDAGQPVELVLSCRPAEAVDSAAGGERVSAPVAALRRLVQPARGLLAGADPAGRRAGQPSLAAELLGLLPPRSLWWSLRLRQYLLRLERSWQLAERSDATVIIDQGFVQAVCSLVLLGRAPAAGAVEQALAVIPRADQWVRVDAPRQLIEARLEARWRSYGWIERRLELDTGTCLRSIEICSMLDSALRLRSARVAHVGPGDSWPPPGPAGAAEPWSASVPAAAAGTSPS